MKNHKIITLTINPALDKSTHFNGLLAEQKMRCEPPRFDAGGGGINVSKAIKRLGGTSTCVFTSGGYVGSLVTEILNKEGIENVSIKTTNWTRENFIAFDNISKAQYEFGFPGGEFSEKEKQMIINMIKENPSDYLVISGSLNQGLDANFYQKIAEESKKIGTKVIVDTSGEALQKVLENGVYLVKPNIGELAKLMGLERLEVSEVENAAKTLVKKGFAEIIIVSLGSVGAILVSNDTTEFVEAPIVEKKSIVGAGDSMLGGVVWALSQDKPLKEVVQMGVCCGTAATMNEGTQLFIKEDVMQLFCAMTSKNK